MSREILCERCIKDGRSTCLFLDVADQIAEAGGMSVEEKKEVINLMSIDAVVRRCHYANFRPDIKED